MIINSYWNRFRRWCCFLIYRTGRRISICCLKLAKWVRAGIHEIGASFWDTGKTLVHYSKELIIPLLWIPSSALFGFLVLGGMFNQKLRFEAFGVDVINFAMGDDFVLAPFRDVDALWFLLQLALKVMGIMIGGFFLMGLINRIAQKWAHSETKSVHSISRGIFRAMCAVTGLAFVVLFLGGPAGYNAFYNKAWQTNVLLRTEDHLTVTYGMDNKPQGIETQERMSLLGTAGGLLFFVRDADPSPYRIVNELLIIPKENILEITR